MKTNKYKARIWDNYGHDHNYYFEAINDYEACQKAKGE